MQQTKKKLLKKCEVSKTSLQLNFKKLLLKYIQLQHKQIAAIYCNWFRCKLSWNQNLFVFIYRDNRILLFESRKC